MALSSMQLLVIHYVQTKGAYIKGGHVSLSFHIFQVVNVCADFCVLYQLCAI
jgi:hypothetical protein